MDTKTDVTNPTPVAPMAPTPSTPPTAQTVPNPAAPETMISSADGNNKNKMILFLVAGLVVLSLIAAGLYFYRSQAANTAPKQSTAVVPSELDSLDQDLQTVDSTQTDDLSSIDQDLKNL